MRKTNMSRLFLECAADVSLELLRNAIIKNLEKTDGYVDDRQTAPASPSIVFFEEVVLTENHRFAAVWTQLCKEVRRLPFFFGGIIRVSSDQEEGTHLLTFHVCSGECRLCDSVHAICRDPGPYLKHPTLEELRVQSYTMGYCHNDRLNPPTSGMLVS